METNKAIKRLQRRVAVTSLSQILAGEKSCEYSLWFRSRFTYEHNGKKLYHGYSPSDGKDKDPTSSHSKLVSETVKNIKNFNNKIFTERQFWHETKSGLFIIGRPDLVTVTKYDELRVYECKTKEESPSDKKQAALYVNYLPFIFGKHEKVNGFVVYKAYDGEEGLEHALKEQPDIILLDILIPKFDGITLLSKLREDEWGNKVPVVIMSNLSFSNYEINACIKYNVKKYLTKADWDINSIVDEVEKNL